MVMMMIVMIRYDNGDVMMIIDMMDQGVITTFLTCRFQTQPMLQPLVQVKQLMMIIF